MVNPNGHIVYFALSHNYGWNGNFRVAISIILPGGATYKGGDQVCMDPTTMGCLLSPEDWQPSSKTVQYIFYGRGEKYCPLLNVSLPFGTGK